MKDKEWIQMLVYKQELHSFSRALLSQSQNKTLTSCERELLVLIYLEPDKSTPFSLSKHSGMKKESVSRSLKRLFEKGYIQKEKHPLDDRSYNLSLTEEGHMELRQNYGAILQPLYDLRRSMGSEFDTLFKLIITANEKLDHLNK